MAKSLFKRGYEAAREEKQRQDAVRETFGKRLYRFFLKDDGDEADVRFMTEEPVNFMEHTVKTYKGDKEVYDSFTCSGDNCPYCEDGNKPTFKGAFLIYDKRPYEVTDDKGKKKTIEGSVKLYVTGTRVLSQLDRLSSRYGLTSRDYTIARTGKGTQTSYMIERGDDVSKLTSKQIENLLPEKLRNEFDGSMDSLYSIIEEQLEMCLPENNGFDDDEDEDDDYKGGRNLVDDDEDENDEVEQPVKKKSGGSVKSLFKKAKRRT